MTDPAPLDEQIRDVIEAHLREIGMGGMMTGIIAAFEYVDLDGDIQAHVIDPISQPIHRGAGLLKVISSYVDTISESNMIQHLCAYDEEED